MSKKTNTKRRISITILPSLDDMLQKLSLNSGSSKSALIEKAVRRLFEEQLDKDTQSLAKLHFGDLPTEKEWFSIQSDFSF